VRGLDQQRIQLAVEPHEGDVVVMLKMRWPKDFTKAERKLMRSIAAVAIGALKKV
jgi:hypothetical protein